MIPTAFLRVYLPLEAFNGAAPPVVATERPGTVRRAGDHALIAVSMEDSMLVAEWEGEGYGCPRMPRLRAWEGLLAFRNAYADVGAAVLVPETVAQRAMQWLDEYSEKPLDRSYILTSPWHVPLRWFLAFDPEQKEIVDSSELRTLRYRSTHADAVARLARAVELLRGSAMDEVVVAEIGELQTWLRQFEGPALVELDYGSVAGLFSDADLATDDSAADLWSAVDALAADDWEGATAHYVGAAMRWSGPMAVTFSS